MNNPLRYWDDGGETAQDRVNAAYGFAAQNIPYVSGGKEPGCGLDCSGLVQNVLRADPDNPIAALDMVQTAAGQASLLQQGGYYSTDINTAQPGDVVFFRGENGSIVHTGIVVDIRDGKVYFVHAPRVPYKVRVGWVRVKDLKFGKEKFGGVGRPSEPSNHPNPNPIQSYSQSGGLWGFLEEFFFNWTPPPPPPPPQEQVTSTFVCGVQGTPPCE